MPLYSLVNYIHFEQKFTYMNIVLYIKKTAMAGPLFLQNTTDIQSKKIMDMMGCARSYGAT